MSVNINEIKNSRKFLKISAVILTIILISLIGIFFLALHDDNTDKYSSEPSVDIFSKAIVAAITTKEVTVTKEELNGFLAYMIAESKFNKDNNLEIKGIYIDINENTNFAKLYIPITYRGIELGLSGKLEVYLNINASKIDLKLSGTKVGKMPVSPKIVAKIIAQEMPEKLTYQESVISFDSEIKFDFKGQEVALNIQQFEVKNGGIALRTKGIGATINNFIKDKIGISLINGDEVINSWIDNISDLLLR